MGNSATTVTVYRVAITLNMKKLDRGQYDYVLTVIRMHSIQKLARTHTKAVMANVNIQKDAVVNGVAALRIIANVTKQRYFVPIGVNVLDAKILKRVRNERH